MSKSALSILCLAGLGFGATNPIVTDVFTADPCAMVYNDTVYVYTGHDEATSSQTEYVMKDWYIFSSADMDTWVNHGASLSIDSFTWMTWHAWASHVIPRNGKFYWYVTGWTGSNFAIGVAVADSPTGPFTDALGAPLITDDMTGSEVNYDIDPAVFIDDDGQAYIYWGNGAVKAYKLKEDMITLEGSMVDLTPTSFTEAVFMHKRSDYYFMTYAYGWEERLGQATSKSPLGPFTNSQVIAGYNDNSNTTHAAFIQFHNQWYYVYHTGSLGGSYRRALAVDYAYYDNDSTIAEISMTTTGVGKVDHTPLSDGVYKIKMKHSDLFLEDSSGIVLQNSESDGKEQLWLVKRDSGYSYSLKNLSTEQYLTFPTQTLLDTVQTSADKFSFVIENFTVEQGYRLYADTAREYVGDILNVSTDPESPMIIWKQTGTENQSCLFEYQGTEADFTPTHLSSAQSLHFARVLSADREGIRFSSNATYALWDLRGRLIEKGYGDHVRNRSVPAGIYCLRLNSRTQWVQIH